MRMATSLDWIVLEIFLNSSQRLSHKRYQLNTILDMYEAGIVC